MTKKSGESARAGEASPPATTVSGRPIQPLYGPDDLAESGGDAAGYPGQYPFTRGIHASMYTGQLWTMRQFAGFGTPDQTNERFRFLVEKGQTGLSTAFDLPTLMGLDSDDDRATGEVGRLGVALDTLDDMNRLFDGINVEDISVSMTINAPAIIVMAYYLASAADRGFDLARLRGTLQNDVLKEFHAQNEYVYPPEPSVRLVTDVVEFCARNVPQWNPVSISGYHIREAGSTALQELAFTLADGMHYVAAGLERGLEIDDFAHRLSFFFNAHNDVFEEVAKYRAARQLWADHVRNECGAKNEASWKLRFHAQTAGCTLHDKQPELNLIRVAYQALSAVLGGCQSLHTNAMDETLALPSEHTATLALRTQQILAHETGVTNSVDPLGGSYMLETLTQQMTTEAKAYFARIDGIGGMMAAIDTGFFRREIADTAFAQQREIDAERKIIVGVNAHQEAEERPIEVQAMDETVESDQIKSLGRIKRERSIDDVSRSLDNIRRTAEQQQNMLPTLIDAARARVTLGEAVSAMAEVFGRHTAVV